MVDKNENVRYKVGSGLTEMSISLGDSFLLRPYRRANLKVCFLARRKALPYTVPYFHM
jgi:hypothetical protein